MEDTRTASQENCSKTVKTHSSRACRARVTMLGEMGKFSLQAGVTFSVSRERKAEPRRLKRAALSNLRTASREWWSWLP